MSKNRIQNLVNNYKLASHPEGGYYCETYRGKLSLNNRSNATSIYFLLDGLNVSHFHSIKSDELWYHHEGDPLKVHMVSPEGEYSFVILGNDIEKGEKHQALVPANYIFGSEIIRGEHDYSFVGCVVSPGFDFEDFKLYSEKEMLEIIPNQGEVISRLT
jgi:predicted cupin superfamily sugar epimerase